MITHSVFFRLKHKKGSDKERDFLERALRLDSIPSVRHLRCVNEVSPKNSFDFGLIMEFEDRESYDSYSAHPDHVAFVENYWLKEVEEFLEIDYMPREE